MFLFRGLRSQRSECRCRAELPSRKLSNDAGRQGRPHIAQRSAKNEGKRVRKLRIIGVETAFHSSLEGEPDGAYGVWSPVLMRLVVLLRRAEVSELSAVRLSSELYAGCDGEVTLRDSKGLLSGSGEGPHESRLLLGLSADRWDGVAQDLRISWMGLGLRRRSTQTVGWVPSASCLQVC